MRLVHPHLFLRVTLVAEVVPSHLQEELGDDAVSQVAVFALLYGRVQVFHSQVLVREFRMTVQAILAGKFFPCRRPGSGMEDDQAQEENRSECNDSLFCK